MKPIPAFLLYASSLLKGAAKLMLGRYVVVDVLTLPGWYIIVGLLRDAG